MKWKGIKIMLEAVIQSSFFVFINVKGIQNKEHGDNNKKCNLIEGDFYYGCIYCPFEGINVGNFIQCTVMVGIFRLDQNYNEFYKIRN